MYNSIYNISLSYQTCNESTSARAALNQQNGISESPANYSLDLCPNPASEVLLIQCPHIKSKIHIQIVDVSGREVLNQQLNFDALDGTLPLNLPNGAYLVKMADEEGRFLTKKLLIAK